MNINNIIRQETLLLETYENNSNIGGMQVQNKYLKKLREFKRELDHRNNLIDSCILCCEEALSGDWNKSDEGFQALIRALEQIKL